MPEHWVQSHRESNGVAVAGLGLVVLDQLAYVEKHPSVDAKVFATAHSVQIGGPVPTALNQLRRFGVASRLLSSWSGDIFGEAVEAHLKHEKILFDPTHCRTAASTGFAHVWIESTTGRRTIVSVPPQGQPSREAGEAFGRAAAVLHLDGWGGDAAIQAAQAAYAHGGLVTLDAGSIKPATERLLPYVQVLNAPMRFVEAYCGTRDPHAGAKLLLSLGPRIVTVTDGENGAGIYTAESSAWLPAFPVRAVDTCGAGDVFCGGLIYACLTGMPPLEALRFAMATAAIKVARLGNRQRLATREDVSRILAENISGP